jgi:predicted nucleic acid-binding Zn ribbon protein
MPSYVYKCRNCQITKEETLPIEARNKPCESPCKSCGSFSLYIQVQTTNISYQGTMNTTLNFNDRLKDISKALPEGSSAQRNITDQIR